MESVRPASPIDDADRSARIEQVLRDVVRKRRAGVDPDDSEIQRQNPRLLPELSDRLRALREIEAAARRITQQSASDSSTVPVDALFRGDLDFLRESLADYEILEPLDYGGQGVVYRAIQRSARRPVAIKVLLDGPLASQRQRHRFAREVELISRLRHPNIVTLYESGVVRNRNYFAMEYVEGLPADDYVLLHHLSIVEVVRLFIPVCRAVSHAHQHGIIHRDLGPGNILVDLDGVPHILDFGLAKDAFGYGEPNDQSYRTAPGQVFGTLPYLSPEQVEADQSQVDVRSDIYSLAVVLHQLATGDFPYPVDGESASVRASILTCEPVRLRRALSLQGTDLKPYRGGFIADLDMVLLKALSKDRMHRYQSAAAFADDLERCLAGEVVEARARSRSYLLRRTLRKYRLAVALTAVFVALLSLFTITITMMWIQVRTERDNARETARLAHATLDDVITDIDESVATLAGGLEVRDRLLNQVVANRLERLGKLVEADPTMEHLRAALHEKQGDMAYARGSRDEAARHYTAFLVISTESAAIAPNDSERLQAVARANRKLARASDAATAHFERAVHIGREIMARWPDEPESKYALCQTLVEFGRHLYQLGQYERAADQIEAALEIATPMVETRAGDRPWSTLLAAALEWDGDIRVRLGQATRSINSLEEALHLREARILARPADVSARRGLMLACGKLGTVYHAAGETGRADESFRRAVEEGRYLVNADPANATMKRDLFSAYARLIRLLLDAGDVDGARVYADAALALAEALVQSEPSNMEWTRILAFAYERQGEVLLARPEPVRAVLAFQKALALRKTLPPSMADDPRVRVELASLHDQLAKCMLWPHRIQDALYHYNEAYELRDALLRQFPQTESYVLDVIRSRINLAAAHRRQGTPAGDATANRMLTQAREELLARREAGNLADQDHKYNRWLAVIDRYLQQPNQRTLPAAGSEPLGE